jgi:guanylate kinase
MYGDDAISIFLMPPTMEELQKRLLSRATDSAEAQKKRLETAMMELTYKDKYDYIVVNDDLERACGEIEGIINEGRGT